MGLLDLFRRKAPVHDAAGTSLPTGQSIIPGSRVAVDGFVNIVAGLGTNRDKAYYSSYAPSVQMDQVQLESLYVDSWLAGKVVDIPAADMTRQWVTRSWEKFDPTDPGVKALAATEARLQVRTKVKQAVCWERLYGGSLIVKIIAGDKDLAIPLDPRRVRRGSLANLIVLDRWRVNPSNELQEDADDPQNFGLPLYYTHTETGIRIHCSRVVRFGGVPLPYTQWVNNQRWGGSVIQRCVASIMNYDGSRQAAASMMFEACVDILKTTGLFEAIGKRDGESKLTQRYQSSALMKSLNRLFVIDKDREEYSQKTIAFAGIKDMLMQFAVDFCGAADIPMTRVYGQSPGGLNATGESDLANYDDKIKGDQEDRLRPAIEQIDEVLIPSVIGRMPQNYALTFNPLRQLTDKERAELDNKKAQTAKIHYDMGAISAGLVARELHELKTYRTMTDDDVALAEEADEAKAERAENAAMLPGAGGDPEPDPTDDLGDDPNAGTAKKTAAPADPAAADDSLPGDKIEHKEDGWHAYAAGKHIGGPYKTRAKAMRTLRRHEKYDRR